MKRSNVSIFVPHNGCPHQCSFCDQRNITGLSTQPIINDVDKTINIAINTLKDKSKESEIAFFGGSFTAIDRAYMISLLDVASKYVRKNMFRGIRISTRPDAIDNEILTILKEKGVTSIELGAQSMDEKVLLLNNRGHTPQDVIKSSELIKKYGFSLGLQMMTGLYGSDYAKDYETALSLAILKPDTMRIYPTVILKNTELQKLYEEKKYLPMSLDECINLCSELLLLFNKFNIPVIRLGLHDSESLRKNMIAGCYHPAFRELCESRILFNNCLSILDNMEEKKVIIYVNPSTISKMVGHRRENLKKLDKLGYSVKIKSDINIAKNNIRIEISR